MKENIFNLKKDNKKLQAESIFLYIYLCKKQKSVKKTELLNELKEYGLGRIRISLIIDELFDYGLIDINKHDKKSILISIKKENNIKNNKHTNEKRYDFSNIIT